MGSRRRRGGNHQHGSAIGRVWPLAALLLALLPGIGVAADELRIAVAANFKQTAEALCRSFSVEHPVRCVVSSGASGLLYAKIAQGAPFDVLLSADRERPERLEREGLAVAGSRFTYALGQLVFWHPGRRVGADLGAALADERLQSLAIANPRSAPYGAAALEVLRAYGIDAATQYRLVQGESVAQAFQFIASGAADAGFVSAAQLFQYQSNTGRTLEGELLPVDATLHAPIEQQAVLLRDGATDPVAQAFLRYLQSPPALALIEAAGYSTPVP
ncbi:MAG TPA: molybdate ABC transporter substrate-binding protein [Steroidobacteraceae bacterium]|nr:molybdate ABC transporter substrate-binding protein [Steroidobacteraceae bacterium]